MERRGKVSKLMILFFLCFLFFVLLQFISPLLLPNDTVVDISGSTIFRDHPEKEHNLPMPHALVYALGDLLCHQKASRSLYLNQNQLPFCSRCTAIWVGIAAGLFISLLFRIQLSPRFLGVFLLCLLPLGIDGIGQLLGFWESTNLLRMLTGLPAGFLTGIACISILDEFHLNKLLKNKRKKWSLD